MKISEISINKKVTLLRFGITIAAYPTSLLGHLTMYTIALYEREVWPEFSAKMWGN